MFSLLWIESATAAIEWFFHLAAVVPRELTASFAGISVNQPVPEWTTLITSQFCMAVLHLAGICCFVDFGNNVEDRACKFLIFISRGVLAALTQWFFPKILIPSGASGAIGVMGAYIFALKFSP